WRDRQVLSGCNITSSISAGLVNEGDPDAFLRADLTGVPAPGPKYRGLTHLSRTGDSDSQIPGTALKTISCRNKEARRPTANAFANHPHFAGRWRWDTTLAGVARCVAQAVPPFGG